MLEILAIAAAAIVVLLAGAVLYAARKPDTFAVARSIVIAAPPERIFPLIAEPKAFNTWNPFNEDPSTTGTYSGPASGPGARYTFASPRAGTGYSEITGEDAPRRLDIRLVMTKPMACDNRVEFGLAPEAGGTRVTWAMSGRSPLMAKVVSLVIDCDKMCANQFDRGLAKLKSLVEGGPARRSEAA